MLFSISLYAALTICAVGLGYKIFCWFRYPIGNHAGAMTASNRMKAFIQGAFTTLFSRKLLSLFRVFLLDVLLQLRVLRESFSRWFMHMCIYWGFVLLLFMHALDTHVTASVFPDYASTLNPFIFLRNLFGALVILGLIIALSRRFLVPGMRITTRTMDHYALFILAVIMISGILLETAKIVSYKKFEEMVQEYSFLEEEEILPLKMYWQEEFNVVFPDLKEPVNADLLKEGQETHDINCAYCHSQPQWAFMSHGVATVIKPFALGLTRANAAQLLWYIHFLACFLGLAYLPFSKFFHIVAGPVSLLANEVMKQSDPVSANVFTRRAMELDACTHCATCSIRCSVGVVFKEIANLNILPSEKLVSLKRLASGQPLSDQELRAIQEGSCICTSCYRCTKVCPVGINLQDLWFAMREDLAAKGYPELFVSVRDDAASQYSSMIDDRKTILTPEAMEFHFQEGLNPSSDPANTFSACFECQTCTNVCPVVDNYEHPAKTLGLLPHQIMHCLGLGLPEMTLGAGMVWDCVTCYMCQENCPQGVQVADILYGLKNMAFANLKRSRSDET